MIGRSGTRPREGGQFRQLRETDDRIERQPLARQYFRAGAEFGRAQHTLPLAALDPRIGVPGADVADAAEAVWAGRLQCLHDRLDPIAELQIGMPDDRRGGAARAVEPAGARGGKALDELHLANRPHLHGSVGPVHGACLDEHRRADVMAGTDIRHQLMQQIALIGNAGETKIPEVMMRIADRQLRFEDRLLRQSQPVISPIRHDRPRHVCPGQASRLVVHRSALIGVRGQYRSTVIRKRAGLGRRSGGVGPRNRSPREDAAGR